MRSISIIGSGLMGHSIALQAAITGHDAVIYDMNFDQAEYAILRINDNLQRMMEHGLIQQSMVTDSLSRIRTASSLKKAVDGADFIVECVPENIKVKLDVVKELDSFCSEEVIIASSTSTFMPELFLEKVEGSFRTIITHFWNPPHLLPVVEVVRSRQTTDAVLQATIMLLKQMNKMPIVLKRAIPGFVGNRLQAALFREAEYLISQNVCTIEEIDAIVVNGFGRRLPVTGPFLSADLTGLDVMNSLCQEIYPELSNASAPSEMLSALVSKGSLGAKQSPGFYENEEVYFNARIRRETELIKYLLDSSNEPPTI